MHSSALGTISGIKAHAPTKRLGVIWNISFDVDSLDCDLISKGTGTPVSKGFDPQEVIEIIRLLLESQKVACLEVTEVNPLLDNKGNKMAETAFEVLDAVTKFALGS